MHKEILRKKSYNYKSRDQRGQNTIKNSTQINLLPHEMKKCLQNYNLSIVFQEKIKCLNNPITIKVAKPVVNELSPPLQQERISKL